MDLLLDRDQALVVSVFFGLENIPVDLLDGRLLGQPTGKDAYVVAAKGNRIVFFKDLAPLDTIAVDEGTCSTLQVDDFREPVLETQLEMAPGQGRLVQDDIIRGRSPDEDLGLQDFMFRR
jgi:hypothetical protein